MKQRRKSYGRKRKTRNPKPAFDDSDDSYFESPPLKRKKTTNKNEKTKKNDTSRNASSFRIDTQNEKE
eukprot:UN03610